MNTTKRLTRPRRRGVTALLAMLYLILISSLAIGFYAATTVSAEVSNSEEKIALSYLAGDSGLDFMRRQLAKVSIPAHAGEPGYPPVFDELCNDLKTQLNGTGNLGANDITRAGNVIYIPGGTGNYIKLDSLGLAKFRVTISGGDPFGTGAVNVKIDSAYGSTGAPMGRGMTMDFDRLTKPTTVYNHAVASKGRIQMKAGAITTITGVDPKIATIMSSRAATDGTTINAITVSGGTIGGKLTIMDTGAAASVSGGSVNGDTIPSVILTNDIDVSDTAPEFPTPETSSFLPYAVNTYVKNKKVQSNVYVPPNTNPSFNGGDIVQGVLYVDTPNQVTINGNFTLKGFIVLASVATGAAKTDTISMAGSMTQAPLPNDPQFDPLRSTNGVSILAPDAALTISGSSDSFLRGNVIVNTLNYKGSADISVDQGTLMTLDEGPNSAIFNGKTVKFTGTGANNKPTNGVAYSSYYVPKPNSYAEVTP